MESHELSEAARNILLIKFRQLEKALDILEQHSKKSVISDKTQG